MAETPLNYGGVSGKPGLRAIPIFANEVIAKGDKLTLLQNPRYATVITAPMIAPGVTNRKPDVIAAESATGGVTDGARFVNCYVDPDELCCYPPDAGTVSNALIGKTCNDAAGQAIQIAAGDNPVWYIESVDVDKNVVYARLIRSVTEADHV